jgi:integrase
MGNTSRYPVSGGKLPVQALTDKAIKAATCPAGKRFIKISAGRGLVLQVNADGSKWWRFRYSFQSVEKMLSLGVYPDVSLKTAGETRDKFRTLIAEGIDPSEQRKAQRAAETDEAENSFESVASEWHRLQARDWSDSHATRVMRRFELNVFPWLGARSIGTIEAPEVLAVLRPIEKRGHHETAHRVLESMGQVFRYAVVTGRAQRNPCADLKEALAPVHTKHMAALVEPKAVSALVRAIDGYGGSPSVKVALKLSAMLFQRPGEIRAMKWEELDLEAALWTIPSERMKRRKQDKMNGQPHLVPLPSQAVSLLRYLHPLTGHGAYCFPGQRDHSRPMSENTINVALRSLGYDGDQMTAHGFRATARTILAEVLDIDPNVIEAQLAHAVRDPLGRAYNRATYLPQRKAMMQKWADYLDALAAGANVIPFAPKVA